MKTEIKTQQIPKGSWNKKQTVQIFLKGTLVNTLSKNKAFALIQKLAEYDYDYTTRQVNNNNILEIS